MSISQRFHVEPGFHVEPKASNSSALQNANGQNSQWQKAKDQQQTT